ncbi:hypothetical protein PY650_36180 [Rhizobium calliandrae]|uniref:HTH HARE-type domain-containing protein n=1 Tax=Rhizobium calliandrae TaxID=1312182 RepID=A0ABT7KQE6_9HYPH|nr:hypothetical protein [Rhizobium calliandrae]MDL2410874.1 hypothetical protein [Rhizobium calliandrae]
MQVVEELKKKREELGTMIEVLRGEIEILEQQRAAFDTVLKVYDENYRPDGAARIRSRKPPKVPASAVTPLLKDLDKRGALLRILRDAEAPVSTADCAKQVALQIGLTEDDPRLGQIGNVLSRDLDKLVKDGRARYAGVADGQRRLWESAA